METFLKDMGLLADASDLASAFPDVSYKLSLSSRGIIVHIRGILKDI